MNTLTQEEKKALAAEWTPQERWPGRGVQQQNLPREPWFCRVLMPCIISFLKALLVIFLIFWVLAFIGASLAGAAVLFMLVF
jgi:hypothetical protein